jgi:hypothetical protein
MAQVLRLEIGNGRPAAGRSAAGRADHLHVPDPPAQAYGLIQ